MLGKETQYAEIKRRIALSWAAFGMCLKTRRFPSTSEEKYLVTTYGIVTMSLVQQTSEQLRITQRRIERAVLVISLRDRLNNTEIRRRTKITDVREIIAISGACCSTLYRQIDI